MAPICLSLTTALVSLTLLPFRERGNQKSSRLYIDDLKTTSRLSLIPLAHDFGHGNRQAFHFFFCSGASEVHATANVDGLSHSPCENLCHSRSVVYARARRNQGSADRSAVMSQLSLVSQVDQRHTTGLPRRTWGIAYTKLPSGGTEVCD